MTSLKVAIAGYMGSGKTTCSKIFTDAGAKVIDADLQAKIMMDSSPDIHQKLSALFGDSIFEQNKLSYSKLGSFVFSSIQLLKRFNSIVHPPLIYKLKELLFSSNDPIVVLDAALIPLWNIDDWFDYRIWIDASENTRLMRITRKSKTINTGQLLQRLTMQQDLFAPPSPKNWQYVSNNNSIESLSQKVFLLINQLNSNIHHS